PQRRQLRGNEDLGAICRSSRLRAAVRMGLDRRVGIGLPAAAYSQKNQGSPCRELTGGTRTSNRMFDEPAMTRLLRSGSAGVRTMILSTCGGSQTGDLSWFATF